MERLVYGIAFVCLFHYGSATYSHNVGGGFGGSYGGSAGYGGGAYNGPLATPVVLSDGHLADTNEVAAAKNAHLSALLSAKASSGYVGGHGGSAGYGGGSSFKSGSGYVSGASYGGGAYNEPLAGPVVLPSVYLADTREVAAAKNSDYSPLSSAKDSSGYGNGLSSGYGGGAGYVSAASNGGGAGASYGGGAYHGPLAAPVVLSSGYLVGTTDVAAAKGAHYVALSDASSRSGYGGYSGSQGKDGIRLMEIEDCLEIEGLFEEPSMIRISCHRNWTTSAAFTLC